MSVLDRRAGVRGVAAVLVRNGLNAQPARPRGRSRVATPRSSTRAGAAGDPVALLDMDGLDRGVIRRDERRLHLHRLEDQQWLPMGDVVSSCARTRITVPGIGAVSELDRAARAGRVGRFVDVRRRGGGAGRLSRQAPSHGPVGIRTGGSESGG